MKSRRFSFPSMTAAQCPPCEAWRLGWMVSELWMTSAFNIAARTSWLGGMTPGADPAGAAALREWQRMWTEKLLAGWELGFEMQRAGVDLALGRFDPLHSGSRMLRPYHRRTTGNSRRLARGRTAGGAGR